MTALEIKQALTLHSNKEKALASQQFFKTGEGEYAEGDLFLGVTVPEQRKIATKNLSTSQGEVEKLLHDPYHECRLTALLIMVAKYQKTKETTTRREIVELYLRNKKQINNWDLVDSSAHFILGHYLRDKERAILYQLADSNQLWEQRIAIISTFDFIRNGDYTDTLLLSEKMINHSHDLMHKAIGWMLREVGNRNKAVEVAFLEKYSTQMPRTMLRYAIEKFPEEERQYYLKRK
ncbi:MAG: DNA alkylation repair protein [Bacteroidales bacterium]|nr:DNA alkylation repair protein [Bacteroidales bacterium]